jgi:hypothetical protein
MNDFMYKKDIPVLLAFICNDGGVSDADDNFGLKML